VGDDVVSGEGKPEAPAQTELRPTCAENSGVNPPFGFNGSGQDLDEIVSEQADRLSVDLADPGLA
jgi:hypothetical protein